MLEATTYINKEDKRMSHFVGIGLVLGFLLPHSSTALLLVNPLLCFFYKCFKQNRGFYKNNWIILVPIIITLLINLPQEISSKALTSCFTILLYFSCFPMVRTVRIPNGYLYVILGFILTTQLAYVLDISFAERLLNTYYPISEEDKARLHMMDTVNADNLYNYRLGGLYHNSNQCAKFLTLILATFIILNREKPLKKLLPFVAVNYYAILLTGSRTGFVVGSLIIIAYIFVDKRITSLWKTFIFLISFAVFILIIFTESKTLRGFDVIQGFSNSANLKMDTFAYYLSSENSNIRLLIGYLDTSRFDISDAASYVMGNFDSDYGSIIFSYGFIGFAAILLYYSTIFLKLKKDGRIFFLILLWMYSSTIVKSYRALFIFMLLLSVIYSNTKYSDDRGT